MMRRRGPQLTFDLVLPYGWGGARAGSGRRRSRASLGQRHRRRPPIDFRTPVHVTLRMRPHVWNLRSRRCFALVATALRAVSDRPDFRIVHFSVLTDHLHLIVEADDARALGSAMRILSIRFSLALNALMGTHGRALEDRYHAHALATPTEARRALAYVLGNFASHQARRGEPLRAEYVDPFSSAAAVCPDGLPPPVAPARTWLLSTAERAVLRPSSAGEEVARYAEAA